MRNKVRSRRMAEAKRLAGSTVELARTAPELIPALLWLMAARDQSKLAKTYRARRPSDEELAALIARMGEPVRHFLYYNHKALLKRVARVDVTKLDLLSVRLEVLKRLGLGVESLIEGRDTMC